MNSVVFLVVLGVAAISVLAALPPLQKEFPERIVGGTVAIRGEFPWIVQIRRGGHYCGGSIVNANWVVTAAHCSVSSLTGYTLVAGEHNLTQIEGTEQNRTVSQIILHPNYNGTTLANDIALMRVSTPFNITTGVQPANIPNAGFIPSSTVVAAGWGTLTEGGSLPAVLMKVSVPMVSLITCRNAYGQNAVLNGMICAGTGGRDSCQGDSGGPLHSGNTLAGIVSWGSGCARPNYPGVYTEVAYFGNWIRSHTNATV